MTSAFYSLELSLLIFSALISSYCDSMWFSLLVSLLSILYQPDLLSVHKSFPSSFHTTHHQSSTVCCSTSRPLITQSRGLKLLTQGQIFGSRTTQPSTYLSLLLVFGPFNVHLLHKMISHFFLDVFNLRSPFCVRFPWKHVFLFRVSFWTDKTHCFPFSPP